MLLHKTGETLDSVVQLRIDSFVDINMGDRPFELCPRCKRKRYCTTPRGFFPRPITKSSAHLFKALSMWEVAQVPFMTYWSRALYFRH